MEALTPQMDREQVLPLEAKVQSLNERWVIHLPVRREQVVVSKRPVVVERVLVHRHREEDVVYAHDTVRREKLRLETEGEVDLRQPKAPRIA